jgi:hypothetical protein
MKNPTTPQLSRAQRRAQRHARQTQCPPNIDQNPLPDGDTRPDPDTPCWLPTEADPLGMPQKVLESLTRIIRPAYRDLVLEAPGELERTIGNSVVYLTWLELVNQIRLANALADPNSPITILHDPDKMTDRCLQLITAKCQAAGLMLRLRLATEARDRQTERQSPSNNGLPPARQAFQPDESLAPFPLFDPVAHFATDSMPSRVADRVPVPPPDVQYDAPVEPELEIKKPVDQLAAEARAPKSENPPSVDQLNRPASPAPSSTGVPGKLEIKKSVDQLHPATSPNTSSSEDPANGN